MATLQGNTIASTYKDLLQVSNSNSGVDGTARFVEDGEGTSSALKISTTEVQVSGNFTVTGTSTTLDTTNLNIDDALIQLGKDNNSSDLLDIGIVGLYDSTGSQDLYSGLFRDASDGVWKLFKDSQEDLSTATTVNTGATGYTPAALTVGALSVSDGNITNVGDISLDSISSDAGTSVTVTLGTDAGDDFIVGNNNAFVVEGDNDRVGIGTTSPDKLLEVSGATTPTIRITDTTSASHSAGDVHGAIEWYSEDVSNDWPGVQAYIAAVQSGASANPHSDLYFQASESSSIPEGNTGTNPHMVIQSTTGNVGIGVASPAESIHTTGNIRFGDSAPAELYTNSSELRLGVDRNNDNATSNITFYTNNDEKVRIDADGNTTTNGNITVNGTNSFMRTLKLGNSTSAYRIAFNWGSGSHAYMTSVENVPMRIGSNDMADYVSVFGGKVETSGVHNTSSGTLLLGSWNMTNSDEWARIRWGYNSSQNGWDEGLIKHSSSKGQFGQQGFGIHHSSSRSFGIFTSGWTTQQEWKGDGSIYMRGDTGIGGTPSSGRRLQVWSNATIHSASYSWGEGLRIISDGNTDWAKIDFGTSDASNGSGILWGVAKSGTTGTNLTTSDFIIDYRNWSGSSLGRNATVLQLSAGTGYVSTGDHLGVNGFASGTYALKVNGKIYATDDVIAFSDISSKTNFEPIENPLEKIDSISGYTYNKKGDESRRFTGMIAQEVESVLPEAVYTNADGTKGLAYSNTIGLLIEAIKELKNELNTVKQEMN